MAEFSKPSSLSKPWARLGDKTEPNDVKKDQGYIEEIPTFQDFNWLLNRSDAAIAHFNQMGIPQWDNGTEYQLNKSLTVRNNKLYVATATHTNQDPATDTVEAYWRFLLDFTRKSKPQVNLTGLSGGWAVDVNLSALVSNNFLQLRGRISGGALTASTLIYTLAAGYRPTVSKPFYCFCSNTALSSTGIAVLQVASNGELTILSAPAGMDYIDIDARVEM